jgi:chemotaxis protein methyltransferase CheR
MNLKNSNSSIYQYDLSPAVLSANDFSKLSSFIYEKCGIKLPDSKKIMIEARLRKRLRDLNIDSYSEYCQLLFSSRNDNKEITQMIDLVTTNKTDFFREPKQFNFLSEIALPELEDKYGAGTKRPLRIWSAGCSTGEEPYTLSIVINEFAKEKNKFSYNILATDISTHVLEIAKLGIYEEERTQVIPSPLMHKYFLKSKNKEKRVVRIIPELRKTIDFQWLNFMDNNFGVSGKFDAIFCRNVIIYFDKETQDRLIAKLVDYLVPGGYLFLGHSESIFKTNLPITQMAASTYMRF